MANKFSKPQRGERFGGGFATVGHSYTQLYYHIVFSTKGRRRFIDAKIEDRLHNTLRGIVRKLEGIPLEVNGIEDHVHIVASLPAKVAVAKALATIKANSSGWVHKTWPDRQTFSWQTGYGAFSVSQSQLEVVREYVRDQKEHHKTMTFEEEYIKLLQKHQIEYDPRFVFD